MHVLLLNQPFHPDVVATVRAQLNRSPMPSQELIDPLRGVLAKLLATITPGDLNKSYITNSGTVSIATGAAVRAGIWAHECGLNAPSGKPAFRLMASPPMDRRAKSTRDLA